VTEQLGSAVTRCREGPRVIAAADMPGFTSTGCPCGRCAQEGAGTKRRFKPLGGWRFGNMIDGCHARYVLVPAAQGELAPVPARASPSGTLSSLGVHSSDLAIPLGACAAGIGTIASSPRSARTGRSGCGG